MILSDLIVYFMELRITFWCRE